MLIFVSLNWIFFLPYSWSKTWEEIYDAIMENILIFTTKIKTVTTKFTTKKQRKQENSLENLGNTNLIDTSVYKGLMLIYGMIWNRIE